VSRGEGCERGEQGGGAGEVGGAGGWVSSLGMLGEQFGYAG
jgi:hypothetical protein